MRSDFTRHSKEPQQELVEKLVASPLDELIDRVGLELQRKRAGNTAIVPLDNDPVPPVMIAPSRSTMRISERTLADVERFGISAQQLPFR